MKPLRAAVIGICGWAARQHAEAYVKLGIPVTHVVDENPTVDSAAGSFGAVALRDYHDLLNADVDIVSVALPPAHHPTVCRDLLLAGKHVLCEKPLAVTAAEVDCITEAEVKSVARLMPGFCLRFHPVYNAVKQMIKEGSLGGIESVNVRKSTPGPDRGWRLQKGGGAALIKDVHYFDLVPWMLGAAPESVYAAEGTRFLPGTEEDSYHLIMTFPSGALFHLQSHWWTYAHSESAFEIIGKDAIISMDGQNLARRERSGDKKVSTLPAADLFVEQAKTFVECLADKRPFPVTSAEARRANQITDAIKKSMASKTIVRLAK